MPAVYCIWENIVEKFGILVAFANVLHTNYFLLYLVVAIQVIHLSIFYPPIALD